MSLTTEVPTFFGPSESPLFGVVHLPANNQMRGGVLICRSLGKEAMDSVRIERILAEDLALRGFCVLRFDYLGSGDSAHAQVRDDAVSKWVASVGYALEYLTLIGAATTTVIGIRAGCLILDEYLAQSRAVDRVVYLDPAGTGRRYLREHGALYRFALGEDAETPGEVSIIGGRFSDRAAAEFAALKLTTDPVSAYAVNNVLLVGRPAETEKHITALAAAEGVKWIASDRLQECDKPREVLLPVPFQAIDSIVEWIHKTAPIITHRAEPQYLTTVTMPAEVPGGPDVSESIERIEPNGLFAIRTMPIQSTTETPKTVLFFVTSNDSHVGPAREWVELSRRIAAAGSQALRWDPAGLGLSGTVNRGPWRRTYSKSGIVDSIAVARHACRDASTLELVGTCSGAWYAAHTARNIGAASAVLVNLMAWNWRVNSTLMFEWRALRKALQANAPDGMVGGGGVRLSGSGGSTRLIAFVKSARERTKNSMRQHLPRHVRSMLSRIGLVHLPEEVMTALARGGTDVTLIASPEDAVQFTAQRGPAALGRLQSASHPPRLIAPPIGDHAGHHPAILAAIRDVILPVSAECPPGSVSESTITPITGRRIR